MTITKVFDQTPSENRQLQGQHARAHRDNHHLPFRQGVATPGQLAVIEQAIDILLRSLGKSHVHDEKMVRAGLTIRLMLDLGRDEDQLAGLRRIHVGTNDCNLPSGWGLVSWVCSETTKYGWWLPAGVHIEPKKANRDAARGAIWLPVLERTKPWLEIAGLTQKRGRRTLIAETSAAVTRDVGIFFKWAKATLGPVGHSLPRADSLPGILTEILAWQPTGDRTLASQVSGRDMEHSVSRSYYTSLSTPTAAKFYAEAVAKQVSEMSLEAPTDRRDKIAIPVFARTARTRKDPKGTPDTMRSMLDLLSEKPDGAQREPHIVLTHTNLVTRLWIVLALSTASRRSDNWIPGLKSIEPRTGALIVLDKDRTADDPIDLNVGKTLGSTLGRARLVFIHPEVGELLVFYIDHLRKLACRADIEAASKDLITKHVEALEADKLMPFLELGRQTDKNTLVAKEVKPGWIVGQLKGLADVPANFARHTLRSGFLGLTPQSAIDALLGHFDRGTEPWSNGSAFDPSAYRALLRPIFEAHFEEAGNLKKDQEKPNG